MDFAGPARAIDPDRAEVDEASNPFEFRGFDEVSSRVHIHAFVVGARRRIRIAYLTMELRGQMKNGVYPRDRFPKSATVAEVSYHSFHVRRDRPGRKARSHEHANRIASLTQTLNKRWTNCTGSASNERHSTDSTHSLGRQTGQHRDRILGVLRSAPKLTSR